MLMHPSAVIHRSHHNQILFFFFFNDTATTEIYTLSLHDALPISRPRHPEPSPLRRPHLARRRPPRGDARGAARRDARPPRRLLRRPRRRPHHAHRGRLPRHSLHPARRGRRLRARPQPAHRDPGDGRHPLGALRAGGACRRALDPRARVRGGRARPWPPPPPAPPAPPAPPPPPPPPPADDPPARLLDHLLIIPIVPP